MTSFASTSHAEGQRCGITERGSSALFSPTIHRCASAGDLRRYHKYASWIFSSATSLVLTSYRVTATREPLHESMAQHYPEYYTLTSFPRRTPTLAWTG